MNTRGLKHFILFTFLIIFSRVLFAEKSTNATIDSIKSILISQSGIDKVQSLNELAWYYKNFNIDSALFFSSTSYAYAQSIDNKKAVSSALNRLASTYEALGNLDSAAYFHKEVISIKEKLSDSLGLASSHNNLGIVYDMMGNFEASLTEYFISLALYENHSDDLYDVAMVLGNIGIVYKKQKSYQKVLEYYQKALAIYEELDSEFGKTVTKGNIGSLMINLKRYKESIEYSESALEGYKSLGYSRYEAYVYQSLALANDSLHQYDKSESYYKLSLAGHQKHQNNYELSVLLNLFANSYLVQGKYKKALEIAKKALEQAVIVKSKDAEVNARKHLYKAYGGIQDYKSAFLNFEKYDLGNDSLFNRAKIKAIEELQAKYETAKKEEQITIQALEITSQKATSDKKTILILALLLSIGFIIIIGILLRNRLKKKQEVAMQRKDIDFKELQLTAILDSQEKERKRFATDLHDGFGQLISILKLNVESIEQQKDQEKRHTLFEKSTDILNEMYGELRSICFNLMPQSLVKFGLIPSLNEFADKINDSEKMLVEVLTYDMEDRLSELQEVSLYRITQEWINNILKYSDAENITIQITKDESEVTLTIEDNGTGFEQKKLTESKGNGWKNMQSRANLIHADIELDTTPNVKGNMLMLNLPVKTHEEVLV